MQDNPNGKTEINRTLTEPDTHEEKMKRSPVMKSKEGKIMKKKKLNKCGSLSWRKYASAWKTQKTLKTDNCFLIIDHSL